MSLGQPAESLKSLLVPHYASPANRFWHFTTQREKRKTGYKKLNRQSREEAKKKNFLAQRILTTFGSLLASGPQYIFRSPFSPLSFFLYSKISIPSSKE